MMVYVPPRGSSSARIMWVGEMPGKEEVAKRLPHIGPSSWQDEKMMEEANISPAEIFYTNVFRFLAPSGRVEEWFTKSAKKAKELGYVQHRDLFLHPLVAPHLADLAAEIDALRPTLIIASGNIALWALTGEWGISDWRGSIMQELHLGIKTIPTFNPAYLFQDWSQRPIMIWDYKKIRRESAFPEIKDVERRLEIRPTYRRVMEYLNDLYRRCTDDTTLQLVADIETHAGQIDSIGFATSAIDAFCIPFFSPENIEGHYTLDEETAIVLAIRRVLSHANTYLIGQNWHYDAAYIARQWGFYARPSYDTRIAWHTLFLGLPASLAFMSSILSPTHRYWKDEGKWNLENVEQRWTYCCKDCCATFEVYEAVKALAVSLGQEEQVAFENSLFDVFFSLELRGVWQSREKRKEAQKMLAPQIQERQRRLAYIFSHDINPRTSKQMKALFYDDLHMRPIYDRKKKAYVQKLDKDAIEEFGKREPILRYPLALIGQVRSLQVYDSTFVRARLDGDSRLRCSYSIPGTETLRLSSSKTPFGTGANLQNIAKGSQFAISKFLVKNGPTRVDEVASALEYSLDKTEKEVDELLDKAVLVRVAHDENGLDVVKANYTLPNVRTFFLPDEGYDWIDCDLDRADAQVVAWEADDPILKQIFREGVDIHTANAKDVGCTRQQAKNGIHAVNYMVRARTLAKTLGIAVATAEAFIKRWYEIHPAIPRWHARVTGRLAEKRLEDRYIQSVFGFKRYYFEPAETSAPAAVAWLGQHTVAIITNKAALRIYHELPLTTILLQVHDSLDLQTRHEDTLSQLPLIHKRMLVEAPYPNDPLIIPVSCSISSVSWGDVEPLKDLAKKGSAQWLDAWDAK